LIRNVHYGGTKSSCRDDAKMISEEYEKKRGPPRLWVCIAAEAEG
jgi:hypothetical protein